jgi:hypothetical protein
MQKVRMEICLWHIARGNNRDGTISINLVLNLLFTFKNKIKSYIEYIYVISYNYVNIMWELYSQRARGSKCQSTYEFDNDPMKMCFKHKTRMKVDNIIKNISNL